MRKWLSVGVAVALCAGLVTAVADAPAASADTFVLPEFATEVVATVPPFTLVGLMFAPDGRLFVWQKNGVVRIIKNGALLPTPFIDLSAKVNTSDDRGFWGFTFDPNFATNGFVYMTYTYEEAGNPNDFHAKTSRLTRVTANPANPDVAIPSSEIVILGSISTPPCSAYPINSDCIATDSGSHALGTVLFGHDGTLFVGNGDGADAGFDDPLSRRAQDLSSYEGKILRINSDAPPPSTIPSTTARTTSSRRFGSTASATPSGSCRTPTRTSSADDVGWNTWEEQNVGVKGGNYGWPCFEGNLPQPQYQSDYPGTCAGLRPAR
jgi:glucose/arabinose dehydrogenase